jgi:hypothetical protein
MAYPDNEDLCFLWDADLSIVTTRKIRNAQRLPLEMTILQYDAVPQNDVKGTKR